MTDMKQILVDLYGARINNILKSGKLKDLCSYFLKNTSELDRLVSIIKTIAVCPTQRTPWKGAIPDDSITIQSLADDTLAFYTHLDGLTNNKYNFTQKVLAQKPYIKIMSDSRSYVSGSSTTKDGVTTYTKEIGISNEKLINNRKTAIHEMWHSIDEKNLNPTPQKYKNQFLNEIGTLFTEYMSHDFLIELHKDDPDFKSKLDYIHTTSRINSDVEKAREAYLDYLICLLFAGDLKQKQFGEKEIVDNFGILWGNIVLDRKLSQLEHIATSNKPFEPMYEGRYIVASAINYTFSKSQLTDKEKVELMADLNNHLISLDQINPNGLASDFDIVTTHLGLDNIEQLSHQYANYITNINNKLNNQIPTL